VVELNATFSDFRLVKTRQVAQFIFEVDLTQADAALRLLGGVPQPGGERWVTIAPVEDGGGFRPEPSPSVKTEGERIRTRAVLLCKDPRYGAWLGYGDDEEAAACHMQRYCKIHSRSELATNVEAQKRYLELERRYREETGQVAEQRG
jgi:hypothetical protein